MLISDLKNVGLSDKEARVYLTSLGLGQAPAHEIAKQAGVNRATTYVILDSLMKMGLVSSFEKDEKAYFIAESPERLTALIKMKEQQIKESEDTLAKILPELKQRYRSSDNKPKVKYFEGVEGINAMQEDFLKSKNKQIYALSNLENLDQVDPDIDDDYSPRRVKKGIRSKFIYISDKGPDTQIQAEDKQKIRESKHIDYQEFPFKTDLTIYDNKVCLLSSEGKTIGIVIEDEGIADSMKAIFEYIWKKS